MLASVDIYRPAAIDQLENLAKNIGVDFFRLPQGSSAEEITKAVLEEAKKKVIDVVILDSAGRLHVDQEMMAEIRDVHAVLNPVETLFVVDSSTGQDAVNSAKAFNEVLPLTGIVLTKVDGDARGGAAFSVKTVTGKPIKFLGTGETMDALEAFDAERVVSRMLGMGDVGWARRASRSTS